MLANTLADKDGVDPKRIVFALSRTTGSPAEQQAAREYLGYTRFECLAGTIPEKPALRQAQDSGLSIIEARFKGPRDAADEVIQAAILKLESITE
ncbi:hypothetical protein ACFQDN_20945 [Pseudomonas asuensis]